MKRTAVLMTVGISLAEKIYERIRDDAQAGQRLHQRNWQRPSESQVGDNPQGYYPIAYPTGELRQSINNNYAAPMNCTLHQVEFPGAEVESFCYWLWDVAKRTPNQVNLEHIILLPTNTTKAKQCAEVVKGILGQEVLSSNLCDAQWVAVAPNCPNSIQVDPFDLDLRNPEQFARNVGDFLGKVDQLVKSLKEQGIERVVLNITGGYKVMVSIFSSFGFLRQDVDVQVIYKHEDEPVLVDVPPLPVAWDFKLFDEYRTLIRGRVSINFEPPAKLRVMFIPEGSQWRRSPFAQALQAIYEQNRLRRFGVGVRLMGRLPNGLRRQLEEQIPRWEHIWIGDQIPETVEHSRGHSVRVLEYAADLLEPKFRAASNFLTTDELYLLLCCLWLHDIGHTGLTFTIPDTSCTIPIGMFPSLVRRLHNFLSYERIRDSEANYLPENEREAVALISKYNGGKFPLLKTHQDWRDDVFSPVCLQPLEKQLDDKPLLFRNGSIQPRRALLLSTLLRVIDGCDLQSDRVIDEKYRRERHHRTRMEVNYLWSRLEERWTFLNSCKTYKQKLEELKDLLKHWWQKWEGIREGDDWDDARRVQEAMDDEAEPQIACLVGACYNPAIVRPPHLKKENKQYDLNDWERPDANQREILLDLLSLLDRIAFKIRQEAHFRKHSRVKLVYLTYEGGYRFNMVFDESRGRLTDEQKKELAKELWNELVNQKTGLNDVQEVLQQSDIIFEGVYSEGGKIFP